MTNGHADVGQVRRTVLKAARGAVLTAHAAAGLAAGARGHAPGAHGTSLLEVERALRAAEGILRSAVALLELPLAGPAKKPADGAAEAPASGAGRRRRKAEARRRRRVRERDGKSMAVDADVSTGDLLARAGPGGSVLSGDLAEFGLPQNYLVVPGDGPAVAEKGNGDTYGGGSGEAVSGGSSDEFSGASPRPTSIDEVRLLAQSKGPEAVHLLERILEMRSSMG